MNKNGSTSIALEEASIAHLISRTNSLDKKSLWRTSDRNAFINMLTQEITRHAESFGDMLLVSTLNVDPQSPKNALKHSIAI